ncbi:MAG: hypothetical protein EXQ92_15020 [Alphaproteobacteria bacterium]|nr:hypothetical protein [Alphaproteobacteria bacterium]
MRDDDIIIEFNRVGAYVKVTAVDPVSLVEATIVGPASSSPAILKRTTIQKLMYLLSKRGEGGGGAGGGGAITV